MKRLPKIRKASDGGKLIIDEARRFDLYEKLYFHEIELREKLHARVGFPLSIIFSMLGGVVFLIQAVGPGPLEDSRFYFALLLAVSFLLSLVAGAFLWRSYWGHIYSMLPTAREIAQYRATLDSVYKEFEGWRALVDKHFKEFLLDYLVERSTQNARVNEVRALQLHRANLFLALSAVTLIFAGAVYFIWLHERAPTSVRLESPIKIILESKENSVEKSSQSRPPPPPPPRPPAREVKEGVRIPPPPAPTPKPRPPS